MRLLRIDPVESGDGESRYRVKWIPNKLAKFVTPHDLRELVKDMLLLLKGEPHKEWTNRTENTD